MNEEMSGLRFAPPLISSFGTKKAGGQRIDKHYYCRFVCSA